MHTGHNNSSASESTKAAAPFEKPHPHPATSSPHKNSHLQSAPLLQKQTTACTSLCSTHSTEIGAVKRASCSSKPSGKHTQQTFLTLFAINAQQKKNCVPFVVRKSSGRPEAPTHRCSTASTANFSRWHPTHKNLEKGGRKKKRILQECTACRVVRQN